MVDTEFDRRLRLSVTRFFARCGHAPDIAAIASENQCSASRAMASLSRLSSAGHVLLGADARSLRAAHPYSALPTAYWVETSDGGWWANCAFCALGVAAIAAKPAAIFARLGAMRESVTLSTDDQRISEPDLRLHIPLPVRNWHDDVDYTCSNVHVFRTAEDIDDWALARALPRGRDLSLERAWQLARTWYAAYLDDGWSPHTPRDLRRILSSCGISGEFWEPE